MVSASGGSQQKIRWREDGDEGEEGENFPDFLPGRDLRLAVNFNQSSLLPFRPPLPTQLSPKSCYDSPVPFGLGKVTAFLLLICGYFAVSHTQGPAEEVRPA